MAGVSAGAWEASSGGKAGNGGIDGPALALAIPPWMEGLCSSESGASFALKYESSDALCGFGREFSAILSTAEGHCCTLCRNLRRVHLD
jgi:hypothetical protein